MIAFAGIEVFEATWSSQLISRLKRYLLVSCDLNTTARLPQLLAINHGPVD